MKVTLAEQLTTNFYLWEERGRGWDVREYPVELEPAYEPFAYYYFPVEPQVIDDGRKPTFLSNLVEKLKGSVTSTVSNNNSSDLNLENPFLNEPIPFDDNSLLQTLTISLPSEGTSTIEQIQQFLLTLSICELPVSFEIVGNAKGITVQFTVRENDLMQVRQQLQAYFQIVSPETNKDALRQLENYEQQSVVIDFGLSEEFMRPLKTFRHLDPDPLTAVIGALEHLQDNEIGSLQILFQATRNPWTESILRSVSDGEGGSFFTDSPEMVNLAREKTKRPLFATVIRVIGAGSSTDRAWNIAKSISTGLMQLSDPISNELIPLTNDEYDDDIHREDVYLRRTHRTGMLLNSEELASLVHFPSASIHSMKLHRTVRKTKAPPSLAIGHGFVLGENLHRGIISTVSLDTRQRLNHTHIIGATGTGKSTLLFNLIVQDIEQGNGLAVIDPHGDLIDKVISCVPGKRFKDVVLFDPSDAENHMGINILSAKSEAEKNVAASDLVAVFQRMSTTWGDQMTVVLGNAIQAFLESDRGGTLLDLRKFLIEDDFRKEFLRTVKDPDVCYFWEKQHHILRGNTLGSILTRLDTFLRPKIVRKVIAPKTELHFDQILDQQKILLVKLAQGFLGEENSTLLGTLVVSKLHQGAMARQAKKVGDRTPFFLYIDEFQNFITPSLAGVLSGTRKYGLGLILAHQELRQILNQDTGVANSVISNPGTRICFRLGDFDAQKLQEGLTHFNSQDLQNLGLGEAIVRVERSDNDFNLKVFSPTTVNPETAKSRRKKIIELSHQGHQLEVVKLDQEIYEEEIKPSIEEEATKVLKPEISEAIWHKVIPMPIEDSSQSQHRYLQALIKRMAEDRGFRAIIEQPTPDGLGRIDVGLKQNGITIACEVSVTTDEEQEFHNIKKCLSAGFVRIVVCGPDRKKLDKIKAYAMQKLSSNDQEKILYFEPEALFVYLDEQVMQRTVKEELVKGYRVKVHYQSMNESERNKKRESVAQVVLQSMRKLKGNI